MSGDANETTHEKKITRNNCLDIDRSKFYFLIKFN